MSEYNGWSNYETWCINLWIDNDHGLYLERIDMAERCVHDASDKAEAVRELETMLKDWVEEMAPDLGASMWSDLLSAALSEVDWREIAKNTLADIDGYEELGQEVEETTD